MIRCEIEKDCYRGNYRGVAQLTSELVYRLLIIEFCYGSHTSDMGFCLKLTGDMGTPHPSRAPIGARAPTPPTHAHATGQFKLATSQQGWVNLVPKDY